MGRTQALYTGSLLPPSAWHSPMNTQECAREQLRTTTIRINLTQAAPVVLGVLVLRFGGRELAICYFITVFPSARATDMQGRNFRPESYTQPFA